MSRKYWCGQYNWPMRKIRFLETRLFVREGRPTIAYDAGETYSLKLDHAKRWVTRGAAEYVTDPEPIAAVVEASSETAQPQQPLPAAGLVRRGPGRPPGSRNLGPVSVVK